MDTTSSSLVRRNTDGQIMEPNIYVDPAEPLTPTESSEKPYNGENLLEARGLPDPIRIAADTGSIQQTKPEKPGAMIYHESNGLRTMAFAIWGQSEDGRTDIWAMYLMKDPLQNKDEAEAWLGKLQATGITRCKLVVYAVHPFSRTIKSDKEWVETGDLWFIKEFEATFPKASAKARYQLRQPNDDLSSYSLYVENPNLSTENDPYGITETISGAFDFGA